MVALWSVLNAAYIQRHVNSNNGQAVFMRSYLFSQSVSLTQYVVLCVRLPFCLPVCLFQLASGEVSLTILLSNIVGEYCRVFYDSLGPKTEQCHAQTV